MVQRNKDADYASLRLSANYFHFCFIYLALAISAFRRQNTQSDASMNLLVFNITII